MSSYAQALAQATATLRAAGIEGAATDARALMSHASGTPPDRLTLHLQDLLQPAAAQRLVFLTDQRAARIPVSHLIGYRMFWGRRFQVSPDVLDPRPETETLVAKALEVPAARILDLGTGSGCILLSCLADTPAASGIGVDLSAAALVVAAQNATNLGLATRVEWLASDWMESVQGRFDLIVSNPPYIAAHEMAHLAPEVLHEPALALTPGGDGLAPYRILTRDAPRHLTPGGRLIVEIGPTQGAAVAAMMTGAGLQGVHILPDLDGRDRCVAAYMPT